jgi:riboflavin kinase/FMN adenylyltransferase
VQLRRIAGSDSAKLQRVPSLVAIGNFDGVHRGHAAVLAAARSEALQGGLRPRVLTFDPHPAQVLGRGVMPVLTTSGRKVSLLLRASPELEVIVEPFTLELSRSSPEDFARDVLAERLQARVVIVGENFRFGHDRRGDLALLRSLGRSLGFDAHALPMVSDSEGLFSSTRVRDALKRGDIDAAERCLGRPHSLSGRVVHGDGKGRSIGVPTANLDAVPEALPPYGVYACLVDQEESSGEGRALARGVLNIGVRPTREAGFSVEVHLLDFEGDLYGVGLRVHLVQRIRDEQRFSSLEALTRQIHGDVARARELLADRSIDPHGRGAWV